MKIHMLTMDNGDILEVREFAKDAWACPICGSVWPYAPISPPDKSGAFPSLAFGDICDCDVEYGVDIICHEKMPPGFFLYLIKKLRTQWLERAGWSITALRQLRDNLGITEDEARRQVGEVTRMQQEYDRRRAGGDSK